MLLITNIKPLPVVDGVFTRIEILMYNGDIKEADRLKSGDLLMGDDSRPRKVLSFSIGENENYFTVIKEGIQALVIYSFQQLLTLKKSKQLINIIVQYYINNHQSKKKSLKILRVHIDYKNQNIPIYLFAYFYIFLCKKNQRLKIVDMNYNSNIFHLRPLRLKIGAI